MLSSKALYQMTQMTFATHVQVGEKDKSEEEVNCIPAAETLLSWYLLIDVVLLPDHLPWTAPQALSSPPSNKG